MSESGFEFSLVPTSHILWCEAVAQTEGFNTFSLIVFFLKAILYPLMVFLGVGRAI